MFVKKTLAKTALNNILQFTRSFVGTLYIKLQQLIHVHVVKNDAALKIFNFPMESCKPALGQKAKKNNHIMPA